VWGKFLNAGQTCIAPDYLLVHSSVKARLLSAMKAALNKFYSSDPQRSPDYARIINEAHFKRLSNYLEQSNIVVGGQTNAAEKYIAPTIIDIISWDGALMQEEIFGPILPVMEYEDLDEVIKDINAREKPLALYLFTNDKAAQNKVLQSCHFGGGCINDTVSHIANGNMPFGGVGASGMGGYHGRYGFDTFSHKKSIVRRGTWLDLPLRYPPYGNKLRLVRKLFWWL
jgi:aldehyde dehydrogenase (NAD+)